MAGTIIIKIVQHEEDLKVEIFKVRNSSLMELFQIKWSKHSF